MKLLNLAYDAQHKLGCADATFTQKRFWALLVKSQRSKQWRMEIEQKAFFCFF